MKTHTYFLFPDRNSGLLQPHLGSDYLLSCLQENGYVASRLLSKYTENFSNIIKRIKNETTADVVVDKYIFGLTCYDANYQMVKYCIELIKHEFPEAYVIIGGPSATFNGDIFLKEISDISLCFLGESEKSIIEFVRKIENNEDFYDIPNTSFIKNNAVFRNGVNCVLSEAELNQFPSAICSCAYNPREILERYGKLSILTSRGCPHKCTFCAFSSQTDHKVRYYSLERVVNEIIFINDQLLDISDIERKKVVIEDDCFTLNKRHFTNIINAIIKLKPHLLFECQTRADYLDYDVLKQLKAAGFCRVDVSLESTDCGVLVDCKKVGSIDSAKRYVARVKDVVAWCKDLSIECFTTLMCGLPGDTEISLEKTHEFIVNQIPTGYYWNNLKIFAGTELFETRLRNLLPKEGEDVFNSVLNNELTYSNISNYRPADIRRIGDDVSWQDRQMRCKKDLIQFITGEISHDSVLIKIEIPFDFKKYLSKIVQSFSFDTRVLLVEESEDNKLKINSVILAEVFSITHYNTNTNEKIYAALTDISPVIELTKSFLLEDGCGINIAKNGEIVSNKKIDKHDKDMKKRANELLTLLIKIKNA
jgi:radical SAM superfamily enzyme YgiQ (UPF0313 family)